MESGSIGKKGMPKISEASYKEALQKVTQGKGKFATPTGERKMEQLNSTEKNKYLDALRIVAQGPTDKYGVSLTERESEDYLKTNLPRLIEVTVSDYEHAKNDLELIESSMKEISQLPQNEARDTALHDQERTKRETEYLAKEILQELDYPIDASGKLPSGKEVRAKTTQLIKDNLENLKKEINASREALSELKSNNE